MLHTARKVASGILRRSILLHTNGGNGPRVCGNPADEILFEHHQILRRLFETVAAMDPENPERRDMMRLLAGELEIHEYVEDQIFYPAVNPVSEEVPSAYAEHQQLADMLGMTLRLGPSTPAFEEQLRALHQAVEHHASSEEQSMFKEAQRLGDTRLRQLGAEIEALLDHERESRARSAFRALKFRLLEGWSISQSVRD